MWTKKAVLYTGGGTLSILFSLTFSSFQLMFFGITLLSLLLLGSFGSRSVKLDLKRTISNDKVFEENDINIELSVENRGRRTGLVEIRDKLAEQVKLIDGSNYNFVKLKKGENTTLKYMINCPLTGLYSVGPLNIRFSDPFSLFYEMVNIDNVDSISIYPKIDLLKDMKITKTSIRMYPGALSIRSPGAGSEFYSIREYVPGDPFKDINWKAYGRSGKLLVNEHMKDVVSDVTIVVDDRRVSLVGVEEFSPIKYSLRAAATLTETFLKRRDSVSLIIYNDEVKHIKPGGGDKQKYQILTALAGAVPKGDLSLGGVLEITMPYLPPRTPIVIFSTLYKDDTIMNAVRHIRALGNETLIFSPNPILFAEYGEKVRSGKITPKKKPLEQEKDSDSVADKTAAFEKEKKTEDINMAHEIMKIERSVMIAELRSYGAKVIDWKPEESFMTVLMEALTSV